MVLSPSRDSASHIQLLEQVIQVFPSDRWLIIEDNLITHNNTQESRCEDSFASLARDPDTVHPQICMLAQPDRTLVEAATLPGVKRTTFREC